MSIYVDLNNLFHAVRSNNANEVAFIIHHSSEKFISNPHLAMALEEGNIGAASELLKRWHPFVDDMSLQFFIDTVDDATFARNALEQIGTEILRFDRLIMQAARLGKENWVKELADFAENYLWNAPDFQAEIDFWVGVVREGPEVAQLMLKHMIVNIEALRPAFEEAQQNHTDVVGVLTPFVQRLETIEQARAYAANKDIPSLKHLLSTMSYNDIRTAYSDAENEARLPSVWLKAVPSLKIFHNQIPWMLATALFKNDMAVVPLLLEHYTVVEEDQREDRKHEPNVVARALNNPLGLKMVLEIFPTNHPHVVCAIDIAAKDNNRSALQDLLAHSPSAIDQALFSSLSSLAKNATTEAARFVLDQASDQELAMCVRILKNNTKDFANIEFLSDVIEPRLERWRMKQHIDSSTESTPKRKM